MGVQHTLIPHCCNARQIPNLAVVMWPLAFIRAWVATPDLLLTYVSLCQLSLFHLCYANALSFSLACNVMIN